MILMQNKHTVLTIVVPQRIGPESTSFASFNDVN